MLTSRSIDILDAYWASFLGCAVQELESDAPRIIRHKGELVDYFGLFAFFRKSTPIVSVPDDQLESMKRFVNSIPVAEVRQPAAFATAARALRSEIVGPASIAYADAKTLKSVASTARMLTKADKPAADALQVACTALEWEQGGCKVGEQETCGIFVGKQLAALAGYEPWSGVIAQLEVVTHRDFRGKGYGKQEVAHMAQHALKQGLLPQYRTMEANSSSAHMAESLGFERIATSVAVSFGNPV